MRKLSIFFISLALFSSSITPVFANPYLDLPVPGTVVNLSPAFHPLMVKGIKVDFKNPLHFYFIFDAGDSKQKERALRSETLKLVNYFLASLTVPDQELWVNLSPYEKNRIIADGLVLTEMGRDLLVQDYILKQVMATMMSPESALGQEYWRRVYQKAKGKYDAAKIPVNTFNKIWIVPDKALVYEHNGTAVIKQSRLKVMLDQDYLAYQHRGLALPKNNEIGISQNSIMREVILPEIEREVNEGKNFAKVRQINNALILAVWFKRQLKQSLLGQKYANQNKVAGIDLKDRLIKQKIYNQYLVAYKKGVFNQIKEDVDPLGQDLARKRLEEITAHSFQGFPVVSTHKEIPTGFLYALRYVDDLIAKKAQGPHTLINLDRNELRDVIEAGRLRAGVGGI